MRSIGHATGWLWLWWILISVPAVAQESYALKYLSLKDGLPNPSVLDIRQDRQGFMWFATFSGIARYDGYTMQVYHPRLSGPDTIPVRNLPVLGAPDFVLAGRTHP